MSRVLSAGLVALTTLLPRAGQVEAPVPLDEPLNYRVSWLGVHCADMTLESRPVEGKPALVRISMTVATNEFFDGIYKVRSRIESTYHVRRGTTRRYHEVSTEKDRTKDDLWIVQSEARRAKRIENGVEATFDLPEGGVHDPLAMIYRFRAMLEEAGDEAILEVMTTRGAVEARAVAERWEQFEAASGVVSALRVVQEPVGDADFARGGGMTMWLAPNPRRVPLRIDFDLPFGKLVAELVEGEPGGDPTAR